MVLLSIIHIYRKGPDSHIPIYLASSVFAVVSERSIYNNKTGTSKHH
jgi:hypothetical protein